MSSARGTDPRAHESQSESESEQAAPLPEECVFSETLCLATRDQEVAKRPVGTVSSRADLHDTEAVAQFAR